MVVDREHGLHGVERAGADVAEHHPQRAQRQPEQARAVRGGMLGVAAVHAARNIRRLESGALRLRARVGARRLDVGHEVSVARIKRPCRRPTFPRPLRSRQDYSADPVRRVPGEHAHASVGQERPCKGTCTRWSLSVLVAVPESLPACRRGAGAPPLVMARTMLDGDAPEAVSIKRLAAAKVRWQSVQCAWPPQPSNGVLAMTSQRLQRRRRSVWLGWSARPGLTGR